VLRNKGDHQTTGLHVLKYMKCLWRKNKISNGNILTFHNHFVTHPLLSRKSSLATPHPLRSTKSLACYVYPHDKTPLLPLPALSAANKLTQIYLSSSTHQFYRPSPNGIVCSIPSTTRAFRDRSSTNVRRKSGQTANRHTTTQSKI
jgi:hypothetical protein